MINPKARANGPEDPAEVAIYRPFFGIAILTVVTAGCLLGAIALLGVARGNSYVMPEWAPYIAAHANSQLYGWVGFFVIGFALQQHAPANRHVALFYRLAYFSLGAMALGMVLRFFSEASMQTSRHVAYPVGMASTVLQLLAVVAFLVNTSVTRARRHGRLGWQSSFVFASLGWLVIIAAVEPFWFAGTHRANVQESIAFVAQWSASYRESQFLGFVASMIFGVSLVKLSGCLGLAPAIRSWGLAGFGLWTGGLLVRVAVHSETAFRLGGLGLCLGAACVVHSSRIFEPKENPDRSIKYVRAAFGWLLVAGLMIVLEPIHLSNIRAESSHAYTGAIRHALTVGFISQMILGIGMHVVAKLHSLPARLLPPMWITLVLLNIGNMGRVGLEVASDYTPMAFRFIGFTGFIEWLAILVWAAHMAKLLRFSQPLRISQAC